MAYRILYSVKMWDGDTLEEIMTVKAAGAADAREKAGEILAARPAADPEVMEAEIIDIMPAGEDPEGQNDF